MFYQFSGKKKWYLHENMEQVSSMYRRSSSIIIENRLLQSSLILSESMSKIGVELPFQMLFPFILGTSVYWMVGLQPVAAKYIITQALVILS